MGIIYKNSDLRYITRRKVSKEVFIVLVLLLIFEIACICIDISETKRRIYNCIAGIILDKEHYKLYQCIIYCKHMLAKYIDKFFDITITLDTILAASVIFFYSVQDNKKGGIPHRTIMAYAYGSFSLPSLFMTIILMLPMNFFAISLNLRWTAWFGILYTYVVQLWIMVIILKSTSYQISVNVLGNAEIRQYQALCHLESPNVQSAEGAGKITQNPFFVWTYLQHHFEQVVLSNELSSDRLELIRRLLRVPYYEGKIELLKEPAFRLFRNRQHAPKGWESTKGLPEISFRRLAQNSLVRIYEFYYENLLAVLNRINKKIYIEDRNGIYLVIYEFIEELSDLRDTNKRYMSSESGGKCQRYYLMTVCGILNAVMDSNVEEAESVCHYVLNNIVCEDVWNMQVGLYILFQEYLAHINSTAIKLDGLKKIKGLENWKLSERMDNIEETKNLYEEFWQIWMRFTTLSKEVSDLYFFNAYRTFLEKAYKSKPITYFMIILQQRKGAYRI